MILDLFHNEFKNIEGYDDLKDIVVQNKIDEVAPVSFIKE